MASGKKNKNTRMLIIVLAVLIVGCGSIIGLAAYSSSQKKASGQAAEQADVPESETIMVPEEDGMDVDDAVLMAMTGDDASLTQAAAEAAEALTGEALTAQAALMQGAGEEDSSGGEGTPTEGADASTPTPIDAGGVTPTSKPTEAPTEVPTVEPLPTPTPMLGGPKETPTPAPSSDTGSVKLICYAPDGGTLSGAVIYAYASDEAGNEINYPGYPAGGYGSVTVPYDKTAFNRIKIHTKLPEGYHFEDAYGNALSDWDEVTCYIEDFRWSDGKKISVGGDVLHVAVDDFD